MNGGKTLTTQKSIVSEEKEPKLLFTRPELLQHPNIPKPLHGQAPRTLLKPKRIWDEWRRWAYAKNNWHCWACGTYRNYDIFGLKFDDDNGTLDAHEFYDINYEEKTVELVEVVALCKHCHNYVHSGRYQSKYDKGELDEEDMWIVNTHGDSVLIDAGLTPNFNHDENDYKEEWNDWRLIFNGEEYKSKFKDYWEWYSEYLIG